MLSDNSHKNARFELERMGINPQSLELMRAKEGIFLYAVQSKSDQHYVLKYFENVVFRREILHYDQLDAIGVPTIPVIAKTNKALLMEDLNFSQVWRLGVKEDMDSPVIARALADWYLQLHAKGESLATDPNLSWYSELNEFNPEGIALVKTRTHSESAQIWKQIEEKTALINELIKHTAKTICFNDFYYVNLAVSRDEKRALMFDYNFLGLGFRAMDISNVCASLSPRAGKAFREAYGAIDATEEALFAVLAPITSLVIGAKRENLPGWFKEAWEELNHPTFLNKLEGLNAL
jgi:hypothetical protein